MNKDETLREWILRRMRPIKSIAAPPNDSYYLKHVFEDETDVYVSNDEFIAAAISLGFRRYKRWDEYNPRFNMTLRCPKAAERNRRYV